MSPILVVNALSNFLAESLMFLYGVLVTLAGTGFNCDALPWPFEEIDFEDFHLLNITSLLELMVLDLSRANGE